ncbi:hypothetical protein SynBIOSE41_03720 [Synechococcus sp. BIOS-E4-1]|nr:hypothetical protein SynBIOSE41_03720 [Synechococcus sp. BIOS-E4-1]
MGKSPELCGWIHQKHCELEGVEGSRRHKPLKSLISSQWPKS